MENDINKKGEILLFQTEDGELNSEGVVAFFATTTKHDAIDGKVQEHNVAFAC